MAKQQKRYLLQNSGQVTVPQQLREKYSLQAGDEIVFETTSRGILLRGVNPPKFGAEQSEVIGVREPEVGYSS